LSSNTGQKVGEVIITALWPLIWVIYVLVGVVIFFEAAAVYLSWGIAVRLDRVFKKTRNQAAG
jgi:hypothetical protein